MSRLYEHIVFDLDDTLLDTSGSLIPIAVQRACTAMIDAGLNLSLDEAIDKRGTLARLNPRDDSWSLLSQYAPPDLRAAVAEAGSRAFYCYDVLALPHSAFRFQEGALDLLQYSNPLATLHLVTAGDPETQKKKIERLEISKYFTSIHFVRPAANAKKEAFETIEKSFRREAGDRFVSIGNRLDTDIGEAKALGWKTVWIRSGEHVGISPQSILEMPDFEVSSPRMLHLLWLQQFPLHREFSP